MFWDFEAIFMASVLGVIFQVISPFSYFFSGAPFFSQCFQSENISIQDILYRERLLNSFVRS
jgi:hypothetical protein